VLHAAILVIFPMCMAMAACSDFLMMMIPNRLSIVLLVSFAAIAPLSGLPLHDIAMHFAASAAVFAACFGLFAFGKMGGGDAKILTASAVWFGFNQSLVNYLAYVSILGGMLSLITLALRANQNAILVYGVPVPATMMHHNKVPYGIAIGAAAFLAFPSSPLMQIVAPSIGL
jgi:prepilin peptidase CpaA